mmetsp:Transcript_14064/g.38013  ORF Transcript_14064/g.38013 Transcript_14064/m.38013 type:complete len:406 (+) Transcript_14064:117-1334(+)|eukprot:CAMPEP_0202350142 /NCGR_PEP_ID=MMETSP1126-20121109/7333_1 /ASSEMBLY_ACC=CAM_ASM_000457 /TAXON_ID=3047 /ORGANISM="Dunaliella tertiolecta, Strain CCMP1320" /LENGTH=405 /DNA_ID=CAMNT_0048942055 /DNA_START=1310 /DNA_END=2527 /DNA_ORIENTATION=-
MSIGRLSSNSLGGLNKKPASLIQSSGDGNEFNLALTKAKIMKAMDERTVSNLFKRFYGSDLCDRLLKTLLLYFVAMFQMDWVIKTMERSRKQHLEGFNPSLVAARIRELSDEVAALRMDISPIYAELLLKYASYDKGQQDRQFFETLYGMLIAVLDDSFQRLNKKADIEREIGAIFRTKHFNLYKRRNMPPRSVDTLAVKELYALKHETANRVLNARMLASLFEKPPSIGVTVASVTNSPLISQFLTSPIVARSMMKDPEQRDKMVNDITQATAHKRNTASRSPGSTGPLRGTYAANSPEPEDLGSRPSAQLPSGIVAEAAGLVPDDNLNHLLMLKRHVKGSQMLPESPNFRPPLGGSSDGSYRGAFASNTSRAGTGLISSSGQQSFDPSMLPRNSIQGGVLSGG